MFGNHRFDNPYDPDDDGRDLEITPEEVAKSDDEGRAGAEAFLGRMGKKEKDQNDRYFRRWLLRLAKTALADGRERRRAARKQEKARVVAAAREAADEAAKDEAERNWRAKFRRWNDGFGARWDAIMEQARRDDAAWEAGRPEREAAVATAPTKSRPTTPGSKGTSMSTTNAPWWERGASEAAAPAVQPAGRVNPPPTATPRPASKAAPAVIAPEPPATRTDAKRATTDPRPPSSPHPWESPTTTRLHPPPTLPARLPTTAPTTGSPFSPKPVAARPTASASSRTTPPGTVQRQSTTPTLARPVRAPVNAPTTTPTSAQPLPPPPPPASPATPEPPPFTGADLAAYRASVGLSQTALAERLGTTQGTVSKAEGNPTALLGPTLRLAMWSAQRGAGGPSR